MLFVHESSYGLDVRLSFAITAVICCALYIIHADALYCMYMYIIHLYMSV